MVFCPVWLPLLEEVDIVFKLFIGVGLGGGHSPTHAGLPRIPGIPLLPGGIPRNSQGQIDVVKLIG